MKRINFGTIVCASALVASAAFGQDQPEPFSPVTGVTTAPGTATITTATRNDVAGSGSVILKVDGSRVVDMTGQPIGRIDNIVLSPVGCTEAAILTAANGRLIPIPWSLVRVSDMRAAGTTTMPGANLVFTVNTDQARLAAAPSFARSQWPDMSSNNWMQASTTFFGVGAAGVGATGAGGTTVTGGATNTATRFGTTATTVPTNSSTTVLPPNNTVLPPTGRPNPGFNQPNTPPATPDVPPGTPNNQPAPRVPPTTPPPGAPPTTPPPQVPPSNPTTP